MIKGSIKYLIRRIGRYIKQHPLLKKNVFRLLDRVPNLKIRLIRIVRNCDCTNVGMRYDDLSPYARFIYRKLVEKDDL